MKRPTITIVGSNNVDLITYIDRMPKEGETIMAPRFEMGFGGKGANQAVAAALLGAEVRMVTKVGDDLFGPNTRKNLESFGIDIKHVKTAPGMSSGVAPIFVDPSGGNSILVIKGANDQLTAEDVDAAREEIESSDLVIMQLEIPLETVYYTIELCGKLGVPVILNPAPADPTLDLKRIDGVSILAPNESELHTLSGKEVDSLEEVKTAAKMLVERGVKRVIVTLGARGSLLLDGNGELLCPPHRVTTTDSTGAGDAFIGCLATYYVETGDLEQAMEYANRYAALSTMKPGTQKSFLDRKSFEATLT